MYESIKALKTEPEVFETSDNGFPNFEKEYKLILDICSSKKQIRKLSYDETFKILNSIKKNVNDYFSITASHFIHAGKAGVEFFQFLMNTIIQNINLAKLPELNTVYAMILYKGHNKNREDSRSYRTISTCPLLAKAIDLHVRNLSISDWDKAQAETQYQGSGMSHELACILLTETINHSLYSSKKPVYALFLDARSAFDRVLRKILIRNMFLAGTSDQRLLYIDHRLANRLTFCEFQKQMMGPIHDIRGLEQGGVSSSDAYKIYNNEQAICAQESNLGVQIFNKCVSCISLADDAVLLSQDIYSLYALLLLTISYCSKYNVQLVPEKTKLIAFSNKQVEEVSYVKMISPISLYGKRIPFCDEADHLGVLRSANCSNMPAVMTRISAHRRQMYSLLPSGIAMHQYASPAACLRIEGLYALPVLLSGLSALVLSKSELKTLHCYYKNSLIRIMRLPNDVPDEAVFFLAGRLPFCGVLHQRILSLFSMICHLKCNPLNEIARSALMTAKPSNKSWFFMLRDICLQYGLPCPLQLLTHPPDPDKFKSICKSKIHDYWRRELTCRIPSFSSLRYLKPDYISLRRPHPLWSSLDGNPYQTRAACIQSLFFTGRYRTERLCRFWTNNKEGICMLHTCKNFRYLDTLEHVLLRCEALSDDRRRLASFMLDQSADFPTLREIITNFLTSEDDEMKMQFLIDCSTLPTVIQAVQEGGTAILNQCFKITRTWCRSIHVSRSRKMRQVSV